MSIFFNIAASSRSKRGFLPPAPTAEIPSYMFNNRSWSWWTNPLMYYDEASNSSYASVVNDIGDNELICINHNTGEVTSAAVFTGLRDIKDEHNTAGILVEDDHILWAVGRRLADGYWVGKVSKDLKTVIKPPTEIGSSSQLIIPCYASFYKVGNRIFIFTRSARESWHFIYSDDGGETWSIRRKLMYKAEPLPKGWLYIMGTVDGDIIKFVSYTNAGTAETGLNRIVPFTFNAVTGEVICNGVSYGSAYDNATYQPVYYNDKTSIVPIADKVRFSDTCGEGDITHIVTIDFTQADYSAGMYRYIKFNHYTETVIEEIDIVAHGRDNGFPSYFGGIFFEKEITGAWSGSVWLSREENGIWYCERYVYQNGAFVLAETVDTAVRNDDICIMRPQPPVNSVKGGIRVWYAKGDWLNNDYVNWETDIIALGNTESDYFGNIYYRATFNNKTGSTFSPSTIGLKLFHGSTATDVSTGVVNSQISPSKAGEKVNPVNVPYSETMKTGYFAYSGGTNRMFLYDDSVDIPADIKRLSWFQGNSNLTAENFFAVKVGSQWFIYSQGKKNTVAVNFGYEFVTKGENKEIILSGGTEWLPLNFNAGSILSYTNTPQALPQGNITGVGMYVEDTVTGANFRIDELEIGI